jgi:trehalose/maltose hydrolase-like predicted phosphorylase
MVSWLLTRVMNLLDYIPQKVKDKISFDETSETIKWTEIAQNLHLEISDDIISQYDGYFDLEEIDWEYYKKKYGNIRRMDRILKGENDSPDKYKVTKQADTLMMFYMLEPDKVKEVLDNMGYHFPNGKELLRKNYDYYIQKTSHGSTLSYVVHSYILKYLDIEQSIQWNWFTDALRSDVYDTQGGTTQESIHTGVMAGTLDIITNCFAGIVLHDEILVNPQLPEHWKEISFTVKYRGEEFRFTIDHSKVNVSKLDNNKNEHPVIIKGSSCDFSDKSEVTVEY